MDVDTAAEKILFQLLEIHAIGLLAMTLGGRNIQVLVIRY
jgi:hypothetical protein